MATKKHKFQKLIFNPVNQKFIDFWNELRKKAKNAFRLAAQAIVEQLAYAKMPPHLRKSINQANLENDAYKKTVTPWKGVRTEWFGNCKWTAKDATCHKAKSWKVQTDMSSLQKAKLLSKQMASTYKSERPERRQQK